MINHESKLAKEIRIISENSSDINALQQYVGSYTTYSAVGSVHSPDDYDTSASVTVAFQGGYQRHAGSDVMPQLRKIDYQLLEEEKCCEDEVCACGTNSTSWNLSEITSTDVLNLQEEIVPMYDEIVDDYADEEECYA